jgi:hypothetical protein
MMCLFNNLLSQFQKCMCMFIKHSILTVTEFSDTMYSNSVVQYTMTSYKSRSFSTKCMSSDIISNVNVLT